MIGIEPSPQVHLPPAPLPQGNPVPEAAAQGPTVLKDHHEEQDTGSEFDQEVQQPQPKPIAGGSKKAPPANPGIFGSLAESFSNMFGGDDLPPPSSVPTPVAQVLKGALYQKASLLAGVTNLAAAT